MDLDTDEWYRWLSEGRDAGDARQRDVALTVLSRVRDRVLDGAGPLDGATLLDVGCGDGLIGLEALDRVGPGGLVVFSDISAPLLRKVAATVHAMGVSARAEFIQAESPDLAGVPDRSVDAANTRSVLIYVADKAAALRGLYRVLRPGGRISLFEPINCLMYPEPEDRFHGYDISAVRPLADAVKRAAAELADPATDSLMDFDDRDLFVCAAAAGFEHVRLTLTMELGPWEARPQNFDVLLNSSSNPLVAPLREIIARALSEPDQARFIEHLRAAFDATEPVNVSAYAYLTARRPRWAPSGVPH